MAFEDAMNLVRTEYSSQPQQANSVQNEPAGINWDEFMDEDGNETPQDEEWPHQRHMRLIEEEEMEQQAHRRGVGRPLTAPANEIRRRRAPTRHINNDAGLKDLRAKQLELLNKQIEVENMRCEEAKERIKLITAQRKIAEIDLRMKENQRGEDNEQ